MAANFIAAYARVAAFEGSYSNVRADRGGETYAGIARVAWPEWPGWTFVELARKQPGFPASLDSSKPLHDAVQRFYYDEFWTPLRGPAINDQDIATELFEQAVNLGRSRAVKHMQRSLNALLPGAPLTVDGAMGPATVAALNTMNTGRRKQALLTCLNILQGAHYIALMEADPTQEAFAYGWLSRCTLQVS